MVMSLPANRVIFDSVNNCTIKYEMAGIREGVYNFIASGVVKVFTCCCIFKS